MSPNDNTLRAENHSSMDEGTARLEDEQLSASPTSGEQDRKSSCARSHLSACGPVEPPFEPIQACSLPFYSIFSTPAITATGLTRNCGPGDGFDLQSAGFSSRPRQASSLPGYPAYQDGRQSLAPRIGQRNLLTPIMPSSPFVPEPCMEPSSLGQRDPVVGPPSSAIETRPPISDSHRSLSRVPNSQTSVTLATNTSFHEAIPEVSQSTHTQFGFPSQFPPRCGNPEPLTRFSFMTNSQRPVGDEFQQNSSFLQRILLSLGLKSGSSTQAAKRKTNSKASRRCRDRKRNEVEMMQRLNAQENEIRNQTAIMHRQAQEIGVLIHERNHYRSEKDFYRDQVARSMPVAQNQVHPSSLLRPT